MHNAPFKIVSNKKSDKKKGIAPCKENSPTQPPPRHATRKINKTHK